MIHRNRSTTKLWRLWPWPITPAKHQVNLLALLLLQEQGDYLASTPETRSQCTHKTSSLRSLAKLYTHIVATRRTDDKPTVSLRTDDNGTPATWTLISFQRVIDRQDRTLQSRRTLQLYWNHRRYTLHRNLSHYYRTRTHRTTAMTCLVGYTPLRLRPAGHNDETPRKTPRRRRLRIADLQTPSHRAPP